MRRKEFLSEKDMDLVIHASFVVEALLKQVGSKHKPEEYPDTCGACGTPAANCDTGCMDATYMAEHDAAISRAEQLLLDIKRRLQK